ncbi:MAG: hypothetical protein QNJ46_09995 [Leptolyngbyaceae cyanobacterium MO_188.B28]|nr:hypothetical protein [Leptolyngbyaceae cyanobacterium MO_188.B28]
MVNDLEMLHKLQTNPITQHILVNFLTCRPDLVNRLRLKELGVKGVIAKPFDPLTLANWV